MSLGKMVAKSLVWTTLESFGLSGLSLICLVVFARSLTPEQFGVAAVALAIVQGLQVPTELLFNDVLIQREHVDEIHIDSAFTVTVALGFVTTALCWLFAGVIETATGTAGLAPVLRWTSLSLIGTGFSSVLMTVQRRRLEFRAVALRSLIGRAGSAVIAIGLAFAGFGVWSLVVQQVLLLWLGTATLWLLSKDRPRFRFSWQPTKELLAFGWISTLFHQTYVLVPRAFMVLVGSYLGTADAGFLSLAFRGVDMLRDLLTGAVAHLAAPVYARLREDRDALAAGYVRSIQLTALVTYPVFVGLATCAPEVLLLVFGEEWVAVTPYFIVVALLTLPFFLLLYSTALFHTLNKPSAPLFQTLIELLYILLAMVTVGRWSMPWAMGVWAARWLVSGGIGMWLLKRVSNIGIGKQLQGALVPTAASAGMALAVLATRHYLLVDVSPLVRLIASIAVGALGYLAMLMLVGRDILLELVGFVRNAVQARLQR